MEWVEVRGKDVDVAVAAALEELGLEGTEAADIEILQQPERGFLGMGGKDAIVRVKPKPKQSRRRRRGGRGRNGNGQGSGKDRRDAKSRSSRGSSGNQARDKQGKRDNQRRQAAEGQKRETQTRPGRQPRTKTSRGREQHEAKERTVDVEADTGEQAELVKEFLTGLLDAFGLEGTVECTVEDDIIIADVSGEQTEALVGPKGAILQAILELSRTIVQRKSQAGARIRLDVAGYTERRREALRIYTGRLVEKVLQEGGEIMLEPMNAADRKVVHDAAAELGGVRTFSEGEEPRRSVVIAKVDEE